MSALILFIVSLSILGNLSLGLFTYFKNKNSDTNKMFFLFILTLCAYTFFNFLSLNQSNAENMLVWIKIVMGIAVVINLVFYLLVLTFPQKKMLVSRNQVYIYFIITAFTFLLTQSNLVFSSIVVKGQNTEPIPGIGMPVFLIHTGFFMGYGFIKLINKYRKSSGIERMQLKYFLSGTLFLLGSILITNLLFVLIFKTSAFIGFLPIYILIFVSIISYAIIKHRFLDIHLIVARSVAYALLLILLAIAFVFGFIILALFVTKEAITTPNLIASGLFTLVLVFSFQPLRKYLEEITAQTFYRKMYSAQTLLWNMSRILASTDSIAELTEQILKELTFQMSIMSGSIILVRDCKIVWNKKTGEKHFENLDQDGICKLLNTIVKTSKEHILIFDEMYESAEKKIMRDNNISALLALIVHDEAIGAIILSEKASGDIYSLEDIGLLKIITPEIAIALKNSLSYDEIKRFNTTLQQEVAKATDEVKNANEQMYKRNLDLAERNKTLALLRKIDDVILTSVIDTKKVAQKVADMIILESPVKSILIALVSEDGSNVYELATAPHAIMHMVVEKLNHNYQGVKLPITEKDNVLVATIEKKIMHITSNLYDIVRPMFLKSDSDKLQNFIGAKSHAVYPMIAHGKVIGAVSMGLHNDYVTLTDHQKDLISRLVNVIGIAIDNALLYQKIADANERLKQLDLLKDEFVSVASHELRTPMTAIKSYLWLALAEKAGPLNEKLRFYLDRSYLSTNRLIKLVNDMLNVSRIESGRMSFDMEKIDLAQLVEDTISEVKPRADELSIQIVNNVSKGQNIPSALADQDKVKEVLINLIGNSLKFTPKSGTITVWFEQKDNMLITNVTDSGEGISQDDIPKLFQKFGLVKGSYQTNKQSAQGTGLGLYICKAIMQEHGGDIWATSEGHGKGATFSFSLKVYSESDYMRFRELSKKDGLGIIHSEV